MRATTHLFYRIGLFEPRLPHLERPKSDISLARFLFSLGGAARRSLTHLIQYGERGDVRALCTPTLIFDVIECVLHVCMRLARLYAPGGMLAARHTCPNTHLGNLVLHSRLTHMPCALFSSRRLLVRNFYLILPLRYVCCPCIFHHRAPRVCNFVNSTRSRCRNRVEMIACVHHFRRCCDGRPSLSIQVSTPCHLVHTGSQSMPRPGLAHARVSLRTLSLPFGPKKHHFHTAKTPQMQDERGTCFWAPTPISRCNV